MLDWGSGNELSKLTKKQLEDLGYNIVIYPVTSLRLAMRAVEDGYAALKQQGDMYFVDSRTTVATVARRLAWETGVPSTDRNVFLDNDLEAGELDYQFERLLKRARSQGSAVAIGHPYPQTMAVLYEQLPRLADQGIEPALYVLPESPVTDLQ